jgi:cell wall assembly regulator SMI1
MRASFRVHDGSDGAELLPGWEWYSLAAVVDTWEEHAELLDGGDFDGCTSEPDGPIRTDHWSKWWVPFTSDGGGDAQCVDLDPAPGGRPGQVIDWSHETRARRVLAGGLREYLEWVAGELESGRVRYDGTE